jgi:hypothetical protein
MTAHKLKVGDRIRILSVPGEGVPNYYIHRDTTRVFKKLIARNRAVRVSEIDEYGQPWYICKFKKRHGRFETHFLAILDGENNWVLVKRRKT